MFSTAQRGKVLSSKVRSSRPRRAAQTNPKTPFTDISKTISDNMENIGKTVTVTATSGIMLTVGIPGQAFADTQVSNVSRVENFSLQEISKQENMFDVLPSYMKDKINVSEKLLDGELDYSRLTVGVVENKIPEPVNIPAPATSTPAPATSTPAPSAYNSDATPNLTGLAGSAAAELVIAKAKQGLGVPYLFGGSSFAGWDCSGYVAWVYQQALGIILPRTSQAMATVGVQTFSPEIGDLVIMRGGSHVAIYAGNNSIYEASIPGVPTSLNQIWDSSAKFISMNR